MTSGKTSEKTSEKTSGKTSGRLLGRNPAGVPGASPRHPGPEGLARLLGLPAPTPQQARVISHPLTPLLVVAGAGSGKTATMSQRVVYLVSRGAVRAEQVLGLTFTRKATAELAQRVSTRLDQLEDSGLAGAPEERADRSGPTVSTYNAFAASLVRDHGLRIGVDPDSTLITEARAWQVASGLIEARTRPLPLDRLTTATRVVLRLDAALAENLLSVEDAAAQLEDLTELLTGLAQVRGLKSVLGEAPARSGDRLGMLEAVAEYRDYKRRHGLVGFGDQVALACRIVEEAPEAAAQVRAQYPAVLLDEFQDTSVAQVRLLSALFAGGGVTAVGDPNQAIYGWRGASAGALDSFHRAFNPAGWEAVQAGTGPDSAAPVLPLSTAWRNDAAVLAAANAVSEPLRNHTPRPGDAQVTHIPVEPLRARPGDAGLGEGLVAAAFLADPVAEASTVADFMRERWHPGAQLAVLSRVRSTFPVITEALEERGVPYQVVGLGGMLSVPEVADVRSLISVAADPERGDRLMRLLTGAGLGASDLRALADTARALVRGPRDRDAQAEDPGPGASGTGRRQETPLLAEALEAVARSTDTEGHVVPPPGMTLAGAQACDRLARAVRRVRGALALPLPDLVEMAERALDVDIEVAARVGSPVGGRALESLRRVAEQYVADTDAPTVAGFLQWLDAAQQEENGLEAPEVEPEPGAVQVLTIHAAKGLEWDSVAVVGMSEGTFPGYSTRPRADLTVAEWSWMTRLEELPHPLRADAATLPPFELGLLEPASVGSGVDKDDVKEAVERYRYALGRHALAEERRLAYVAVTRARHDVLLTGSHLSGQSSSVRPRSRFLDELVRRDLVTPYGEGLTEPDPQAANPLVNRVVTASWPAAPAQDDLTRARHAAADAVRRLTSSPQGGARLAGTASHEGLQDPDGVPDPLVARWWREARLLLAERDQADGAPASLHLPSHLAATSLDRLRGDPEAFALDLRRPLPAEPQAAGRLGTFFHDAVAQRLRAQGSLLGLRDAGVPDTLTRADRRRVERWLDTAERLPLLRGYVLVDSEVSRELTVGGTTLRCRMDAVFRHATEPAWLVVDWKTGRRRVPVDQLSVYVHAWAQSRGVGTDRVRAAYVYVEDGEVDELGPGQLLDLDQIEAALRLGSPA